MLQIVSRPVRGEWIEIRSGGRYAGGQKSRPVRGEWIEMDIVFYSTSSISSRPVRGEWIEIQNRAFRGVAGRVSPRAGRVD